MPTRSPFALSRPTPDAAELLIFGDIGESWSAQSVSARAVVDELAALPPSIRTIAVRINSFGGSVADGLAIHNALRSHPARIVATVEGVAASVASLIAMAGDEVRVHESSLMMVHAPWASATGNAADMRDFAGVLDTYAVAMATCYSAKTGRKLADVQRDWLAGGDNWFTSQEAIAAGLADFVIEASADTAETPPTREPSFARGLARFTAHAPLRIAAALRLHEGVTPMPQATPAATPAQPQAAAPTVEPVSAAAREAVLAELRHRNNSILASSQSFGRSDPNLNRVVAECLADPAMSFEDAGQRILRVLGAGCEPLGGGYSSDGRSSISSSHNAPSDFVQGATDALLQRAGLRVATPHPAARDLVGMSLLDMARSCVGRAGRTFFDRETPESIIRAAHNNGDFPLLLANSANKALQIGFENEPASHRPWVRSIDVNDFKIQSRVQRSEAPGLLEVLPGGEFTHGTFDERGETYAISTWGRIFSITRQAMINDDLGAFTTLPAAFGAAAARLEADKVYAVLTANAVMADGKALFHADHGNLTASGTALSAASLGVARALMRKQMGGQGLGYLNVIPRFLIVPAALETTAEVLVASTVRVGGSNTEPNAQFIRNLVVVVDPRLDATSATAWYLAADSSQIDTLEIGYLRGQRGVFVEERTHWETDAMQLKARLDFGVAAIDWRGLYKNPGA